MSTVSFRATLAPAAASIFHTLPAMSLITLVLGMVAFVMNGALNGVVRREKICALRREASPPGGRAPTVFSERMKSASVQKTRFWLTPNVAWC